ncbi:MAG TPA: sulfotransferase domain-containing protein [Rhizomicrobium sp.]|nr:sulfotransferase domain-containing protein [Rhizomicrobium sp.]
MSHAGAPEGLPVRLRPYKGPITDPSRWQSFRPRAGDIFICAPAKSGTTWTQAICAMLIFGRADIDVAPAKISPWLDTNLMPEPAVTAMIEGQTHRRYFKTHTPLDGIPFYPQCSYVAVYRDPRDTFLSMMRLAQQTQGANGAQAQGELHRMFAMWLREPFVPGAGEQLSLAAVAHHFRGFWEYRNLANIHLVHFADMKRDLAGVVRSMAEALGIGTDDALVARIAAAAEFSRMRGDAPKFAPAIGRAKWRSESDFFRDGGVGQWKAFLDAAELAAYRARVSSLLDAGAAGWLENGSIPA